MDQTDSSTKTAKGKHLTTLERKKIKQGLKQHKTPYRIAKELGRSLGTILNEIKRGTDPNHKGRVKYLPRLGKRVYRMNRRKCHRPMKFGQCEEFVTAVVNDVKAKTNTGFDAYVGTNRESGKYGENTVCTRTMYRYQELGLLDILAIDLPLKVTRKPSKPHGERKNKTILGTSIDKRPKHIDSREEFGHWEGDLVIGSKSDGDKAIMTLVERKTRYTIVRIIDSKEAISVNAAIEALSAEFGESFPKVFKTVTVDNGSEFSKISKLLEGLGSEAFFTHPYSAFEKGTIERHNGLVRLFVKKGRRTGSYDGSIAIVAEEWMNTLPRKILNYATPDRLFEKEMDALHAMA